MKVKVPELAKTVDSLVQMDAQAERGEELRQAPRLLLRRVAHDLQTQRRLAGLGRGEARVVGAARGVRRDGGGGGEHGHASLHDCVTDMSPPMAQ